MPQRILREGILDSEKINELSWGAEVFYRRLMSVADDFGKYDGRLMMIRANCYPLKLHIVGDSDIDKWLQECCASGLVRRYEVDGKPYIMIINFGQRLRSMKSKYPDPVDDLDDQSNDRELPKKSDKGHTRDGTLQEDDGTLLTNVRTLPLEVEGEVEEEVEGDIDVEERASAQQKNQTPSKSPSKPDFEEAPPSSAAPPRSRDPDVREWKDHPKRSKSNLDCGECLLQDIIGLEAIMMKSGIPDMRSIQVWIEGFNIHRASLQKHEDTQKEYNTHFNNWLSRMPQELTRDTQITTSKILSHAQYSKSRTKSTSETIRSRFSDADDILRRLNGG